MHLDRGIQHAFYAELLRHLRRLALVPALDVLDRKTGQFAQPLGESVLDALDEVLFRGVAAQIVDRHDRD